MAGGRCSCLRGAAALILPLLMLLPSATQPSVASTSPEQPAPPAKVPATPVSDDGDESAPSPPVSDGDEKSAPSPPVSDGDEESAPSSPAQQGDGRRKLTRITACPGQAPRANHICVGLHFEAEGDDDNAHPNVEHGVQCLALEHDLTRKHVPDHWAFFEKTLLFCDPQKECIYPINGLTVNTAYDVFCADRGPRNSYFHTAVVMPDNPFGHKMSTAFSDEDTAERLFGPTMFVSVLLVMAYAAWSFVFRRLPVLHETAFAVLCGLACGIILKHIFGQEPEFSYDTFCYFFLPMVIFQAGYCLQKKSFFRHLGYTLSLGLVGTVLTFLLNFYVSGLFEVVEQDGKHVPLQQSSRLKMAAVMASTDTVAPMAFISQVAYPQLFAVVFGEGVLNDVVSVLLSISVQDADEMPEKEEMARNIVKFLFQSGALGLGFGLTTSLVLKWSSHLREDVVKASIMMLGANYLCYIIAEVAEVSSIFALFVSSICCNHYAKYALSREGRAFMDELAEMMAYFAESVVFGYFGLTAVRYFNHFNLGLIVGYTACIFAGRLVAILIMYTLGNCVLGFSGLSLTRQELTLVWLAGCIKGTIAYALILKAVPPNSENMNDQELVMVSTVLGIVLMNCLLVGTLFPLIMKYVGLESRAEVYHLDSNVGANRVRNRCIRGWRNLDDRYLKTWLRPAGSGKEADLGEPHGSHQPKEGHGDETLAPVEEIACELECLRSNGASDSFASKSEAPSLTQPAAAAVLAATSTTTIPGPPNGRLLPQTQS